MKTNHLHRLCLFAIALLAISVTAADAPPQAVPDEIAVGQPAPKFTLKDQNQNEVSLEQLLKKGPVAIVFVRSADWCLYCKLELLQISRCIREIQAVDGQVVSISYDSSHVLNKFAQRHKIAYSLLSDGDSSTIGAYHMLSGRGNPGQQGCSKHGVFVVDKNGIVRDKLLLTSFDDHALVDGLVKAFKEVHKEKEGPKL